MIEPTENDVGRHVIYVPGHAKGNLGHKDCERGFITSFNDHAVFVRYGMGSTSAGTSRQDLHWQHWEHPDTKGELGSVIAPGETDG